MAFSYLYKISEACEINEKYLYFICFQVMFCTHAVMVLKNV